MAAGFAATSCSDDLRFGFRGLPRGVGSHQDRAPRREALPCLTDGREGHREGRDPAGADWFRSTRTAPGGQTVKDRELPERASPPATSVLITGRTTPGRERHAMIRFTFDGQAPLELKLHNTAPRQPTMSTRRANLWSAGTRPGNPTMCVYVTILPCLTIRIRVTYNARQSLRKLDKTTSPPPGGWPIRFHSAITRVRGVSKPVGIPTPSILPSTRPP